MAEQEKRDNLQAQEAQQEQQAQPITIHTSGYNPTLDPNSPDFDPAAFRAAVDQLGGIPALSEQLKAAIMEPADRVRAYMCLTMGQIEQLPDEERSLVWAEVAKQLTAAPGFTAMLDSMTANWGALWSGIDSTLQKAQDALRAILPTLAIASDRLKEVGGQLAAEVRDNLDTLLKGDGIEDTIKLWEQLEPYIEAEYDDNPELFERENTIFSSAIIAAAARRARADGIEIPPLPAEQMQEKPVKEESEGIAAARNAGAITTLGNHVATIADKLLQACFTARDLRQLPGDHDSFIFDAEGKLNELSLNGEPLQPLDEPHTSFLMALLRIADICDLREYNSKDNPMIGLYLPTFFRETGIDPRPREWDRAAKAVKRRAPAKDDQTLKTLRVNRFMEFMRPLDNRVGAIAGEGYYTLARFISWDEKTDTAYISIPYEIKLAETARLHADRHSAISTIFHADILTENQAAVELANRIAVGVIERGVTRSQADTYKSDTPRKPLKKTTTTTAADGTKTTETLTFQPEPEPVTVTKERTDDNGVTTTVTRTNPRPRIFRWESRFDSLIADCPQLAKELDEIRSSGSKDKSQRVNKKLKDIFTAAIRIIMEKSDMPQYYAGLTIQTGKLDTFKAPTNSTLKDRIVITHKGKNPNYTD